MKIKIGETYINKTYKYIRPALKLYGSTFITKFNSFSKLAYGVHDTLFDGSPIEYQRAVFILLDKFVQPKIFEDALNWMRNQTYFITDYPFDGLDGRQHMLVIEFPERYAGVYDNFINSKYSEMYCKDEIEDFFPSDESEAKQTILKSQRAKVAFIAEVNKRYGTDMVEFEKGQKVEYDFPVSKKEEYFNQK